ncbi:purple acid phosphatase 7-like isoform X2 [Vicia villosa]|uniref:purple acid phosphatase 7-like isoform X2 n=1 Tax=Vicia villosa TaxID=3911 RepID=UPI00273AD63E|nr:purple acid phosphatase 7-like isoform X2 [Vicia villosa]
MVWFLNQRMLFPLIFAITVICLLAIHSSIAKNLPRFQHRLKPQQQSLNFLVVGDWGRNGNYNQSFVANQMGIVGENLNIDFVISTGDNFYEDGLVGVDDPAFYDSFVNIYTAPSLQKIWYTVLGNHDYRGDVEAQLSPILRQKDGRWVCLRSFILDAEIVEFFLVDTNPFVEKYFTDPEELEKHTYDWRGVLPRESYIAELLKSNNVDAYINGHDHCLEHIIDKESGIQFLTSGGGSKAWRGDVRPWDQEELKLYHDGQGFMSVQITETNADIVFYDVFGNVLHTWRIPKEFKSAA